MPCILKFRHSLNNKFINLKWNSWSYYRPKSPEIHPSHINKQTTSRCDHRKLIPTAWRIRIRLFNLLFLVLLLGFQENFGCSLPVVHHLSCQNAVGEGSHHESKYDDRVPGFLDRSEDSSDRSEKQEIYSDGG